VARAQASDKPKSHVCFEPITLAARPGAETLVKGDHGFDQPTPWRTVEPHTPLPAGLRGVVRRVSLPAGGKLIALSFDFARRPARSRAMTALSPNGARKFCCESGCEEP
jgi:hypothetical protein